MRTNLILSIARTEPHIIFASITGNVLAFALPLFLLQIYDRIIPSNSLETLTVMGIGVVVAITLELVLNTARAHLMGLAGDAYERKTQHSLFERLLKSDLATVEKESPGVHLDRISSVDRVRDFRNGEAAVAALDLPFVIIFLIVVTIISPILAAVILMLLCGSVYLVRKMQSHTLELSEKKHEIDRRRYSFLIEVLSGVESVKSFSLEAFMERRHERLMSSAAQVGAEATWRMNFTQAVIGSIGQVTPALIAGVGAILVIQGSLSVGALAATILLGGRVVQPVLKLSALRSGDDDARRAEAELTSFTNTPLAEQGELPCQVIESMELKGITYTPPGQQSPLFENLDLIVRRGEIIVIDGAAGTGRSALLWMMTGCLLPQSGSIKINGADMTRYDSTQLRGRIAHLSHQPKLIEGTVLENMTRFQPDRYLEDALEVAASLGLDEYFAKHQEGLSTLVGLGGEAGLPTSVAERIPLVGALVGHPDLVLFDEANANLDADGDQKLKDHLASLKGKATVIMVTQRPSYAKLADRYLVIEDHKLVTRSQQAQHPMPPVMQPAAEAS